MQGRGRQRRVRQQTQPQQLDREVGGAAAVVEQPLALSTAHAPANLPIDQAPDTTTALAGDHESLHVPSLLHHAHDNKITRVVGMPDWQAAPGGTANHSNNQQLQYDTGRDQEQCNVD